MKEQIESETQLNSQTRRMELEKAAGHTIIKARVGGLGSQKTDPIKLSLKVRHSVLQSSIFIREEAWKLKARVNGYCFLSSADASWRQAEGLLTLEAAYFFYKVIDTLNIHSFCFHKGETSPSPAEHNNERNTPASLGPQSFPLPTLGRRDIGLEELGSLSSRLPPFALRYAC